MTAVRKTWRGAETLRRFLVPLDQLEPFPGNPRRGAVGEVARSVARFGQVRPVLVAATEGDGPRRIVAGHHVVEAARELGWSHVAAIANEFASDEEARAYLLADNKLSELGTDDPDLLAAQLASLADFEGTGYCCPPESPVLMADLSFRPLGEIAQGDEVIGWALGWSLREERAVRCGHPRHQVLCKSRVLGVNQRTAHIVRLTMASGKEILCTPNHYWLVHQKSIERAGNERIIGSNKSEIFGYPRVGMSLCYLGSPPEPLSVDRQQLAYWLGGIFDGEGSVSDGGVSIAQSRIHNPAICERIEQAFQVLDIPYSVYSRRNRENAAEAFHIRGRDRYPFESILRFVNLCQPVRRDGIVSQALRGRWRIPDQIVAIDDVGKSEVLSLHTETGNYIVWGYASKNSQEEADELAARLAFLRDPVFPETDDSPPPLDERSAGPETFEVPLLLTRETRQDFARQISMLRREWGLETTTDVVVRSVRESAENA